MVRFEDIGQAVEGFGYDVDLALIIDATGSMAPIIKLVKENALSFGDKFLEGMETSGKNVGNLRVKVIVARDYQYDGKNAMVESKFFTLPEEAEEYKAFVDNIEAVGGGDAPESTLEALALAMGSDWTESGAKRRHVISLYTDTTAVPLKDPERMENPDYPENMPNTLEELGDMWEGNNQSLKGMPDPASGRLVLFAPNDEVWNGMQTWNRVWHEPSRAGEGLAEMSMELIVNMLVASV